MGERGKRWGREMEDSLTMVMCSSVAGAKEGAREITHWGRQCEEQNEGEKDGGREIMALWQSRTERSENGRTINDREHNVPANGGIGRNKQNAKTKKSLKVLGDKKRQRFVIIV